MSCHFDFLSVNPRTADSSDIHSRRSAVIDSMLLSLALAAPADFAGGELLVSFGVSSRVMRCAPSGAVLGVLAFPANPDFTPQSVAIGPDGRNGAFLVLKVGADDDGVLFDLVGEVSGFSGTNAVAPGARVRDPAGR